MTIRCLVSIEVGPTVLIMNSVFVAVGMRHLFIDRSVVDRGVVDRGREREVLGAVVSGVVGQVIRPGLGQDNNCQGSNQELRRSRIN